VCPVDSLDVNKQRMREDISVSGPLVGVRVIDFSGYMQGPWATQLLGDMGADVVKIERPGVGDWERSFSMADHFINGQSACFLAMNRNKRSIALDLKNPRGRDIALRLIGKGDVVVENSRPGVMDRLGLGYEHARGVNPRIIYCSASGYGSTGPYRERPGQDLLVQGLAGIASMTGRRSDPPTPSGMPIADQHGARLVAFGVAAALFERERTGCGQYLEVDLLSAVIDAECQEVVTYLNGGGEPERSANGLAHAYLGAPYGIYATKDGYLTLAMTPLDKLSQVLDIPNLQGFGGQSQVLAHRDDVQAAIQAVLETRTTDEWLTTFGAADIWCGPVQTLAEAVRDPQVRHNEMIATIEHPTAGTIQVTGIPIRFSRTPGAIRMPPPLLGEHTDEILQDLGCTEDDIKHLRSANAI